MMDALHMAREAMEWSEDEGLEQDGALWFFAKAQAYAAIAQVEATRENTAQLKRVAEIYELRARISELEQKSP
jgi:hypothetical protein